MKVFTIKKNKHKSCFKLKFAWGNRFNFICKFDESCLYNIEGEDRLDINKLIGLSNSLEGHHTSSIRVGWRCLDNKNIQILSYIYDQCERGKEDLIGVIKPGEVFKIFIKFNKTESYINFFKNGFMFAKRTSIILRNNCKLRYFLWPYFGGNKKAPHKMKIGLSHI